MEDALLVGVIERRADRAQHLECPGHRDGLAQLVSEGAAFHELGDDVRLPVELAVVEDGKDVGVAEPGDGDRLPAEPFPEVRVLGEEVGQDLDGDHPLQGLVVGLVDSGHASAADLLHDLVGADPDPGCDFHRREG